MNNSISIQMKLISIMIIDIVKETEWCRILRKSESESLNIHSASTQFNRESKRFAF